MTTTTNNTSIYIWYLSPADQSAFLVRTRKIIICFLSDRLIEMPYIVYLYTLAVAVKRLYAK